MNVRDMWAAKLAGGPMPAAKAAPTRISGLGTGAGAAGTFSLQRAPFVGAVLGIDPSLRGTGLALIEFAPSRQPVLLRPND
jgi:crossover junction endodeoxyribonuclease RuvC